MLFSLYSFGQEGTASPYSFFGIGEVKFKGTVENKSMGGLGIIPDSIHMNLQNPASLSSLKFTSFAVAGTNTNTSLKTSTETEKSRRTTFDYMAMAFPVGKLGLNLGMMPYSSVGYKIENIRSVHLATDPADSLVTQISRYAGSGGLNKVFAGVSYQFTPKLSLGLDFGYIFGKIESSALKALQYKTQYSSRELNTSRMNGVSINAGAIYQTKIQKYNFVSSLTISPSTTLNSQSEQSLATVTVSSSGVRNWDLREYSAIESKLKLPAKVAVGAGLGEIKKWFVGFESTFQQANNFGNRYNDVYNVTFKSASKYNLGGYFVPNYSSFSNYFNKVTYRAGLRYENTGLVVNSQSINDSAFTLGFGFPVSGSVSSLNLGLEFGQRGTTSSNLIKENYTNISIGLSFSDRWFVKRKFD